jgi:hypothetical protein
VSTTLIQPALKFRLDSLHFCALQIAVQKAREKSTCGFMDNARKGVDHNSTGAASERLNFIFIPVTRWLAMHPVSVRFGSGNPGSIGG